MPLRIKVLLLLAIMWAFISMVFLLDAKFTLTKNYADLEKQQILADITRVEKSINNSRNGLKIITNDWGNWDEVYTFMEGKNNAFIKNNIIPATFENTQIGFILFFSKNGKFYYGKAFDAVTKELKSLPPELIKYFSDHQDLVMGSERNTGLLKIDEHFYLISTSSILTSTGQGPSQGKLIMGYFWDKAHLAKISEIVGMQLNFYPLPLDTNKKILSQAYAHLVEDNSPFVYAKNNAYVFGHTFIKSISDKPIGILRIEAPRTLYSEGLMTIRHYLAIIMLIGVMVLVSTWYLLKIFVLDRILSVSDQVVEIKSKNLFSQRIKITGKDELEKMVNAINSMMEIIELSQEALKYRITQRNEQLDRLSKLNKNLFHEMNQQKSLYHQMQKDEKNLKQMAYYDSLTLLPNRFFFYELLQKALTKAHEEKASLCILFLDADKFKSINDTFGHDIGDRFLNHVAKLIQSSVREGTIVGRLAGDEFILFFNHPGSQQEIEAQANKILKSASQPLIINNKEIKSTFSVGISIYPADGKTADELIKHADLAMYFAKKQTKNAFCFYNIILEKGLS